VENLQFEEQQERALKVVTKRPLTIIVPGSHCSPLAVSTVPSPQEVPGTLGKLEAVLVGGMNPWVAVMVEGPAISGDGDIGGGGGETDADNPTE